MPPFVILKHTLPDETVHWDLMLQQGEVLQTWQLRVPPQQWADAPVIAQNIFDHRLKYLDYEGPLSDNRGSITRHDRGRYEITSQTPGSLACTLHGQAVQGSLTLLRLYADQWELVFHPASV